MDVVGRVLEPFVKLDPSRGHRSGYGLGLNQCQRIVEAHSVSIRIEAREPRSNRLAKSFSMRGSIDSNRLWPILTLLAASLS